jgi:hypothetical protein
MRSETAVTRLLGEPGDRVCGVELSDGDRLRADLIVDASGRGSRSDRWLSELGFPAPTESVVTMRVHYTSRLVWRGSDTQQEPSIIVPTPSPPDGRRFRCCGTGRGQPVAGNARWFSW